MTLVTGSGGDSFDSDDQLQQDLQRIEEACLLFSAAWTQGQQPKLLEYLSDLTGESRRHALCDLLWIEWDHLRRLGTPANQEDYRLRFAEFSEVVDEAWRSDFGRGATSSESGQVRGGRYTILRTHASGGLGQLYVAHDSELERPVALKEIRRLHASRPIVRERFLREAKITGQMEHAGIVPVYSIGTNSDVTPFYKMRFIPGVSLKAAIEQFHDTNRMVAAVKDEEPASASHPPATRRAAFRSSEFRQLLSQLAFACQVIEYAHSRGVVHRDLKPSNIMLGKYGEVFVVDWGLAKEVGQAELCGVAGGSLSALTDASFTTHGALVGTTAYMSPEQAAGNACELTAAIDVYCLGATLYHLLVGAAPLAGVSSEERLTRIQRGEIPSTRALQPAVPAALAAICTTAMSLDPADRYESAAAMARDLECWLADQAVSVYAEPRLARLARWARHHPVVIASSAIATVLVALSLGGITGLMAFKNSQLTAARSDAENRRIAAEFERDQSEAIAAFLVKCFRSPDPGVDGSATTVAEILDRSFKDLQRDPKVAPGTKARLFEALIQTNLGLGLHSNAVAIAEYAWQDGEQPLAADQEQLLSLQASLAAAYLDDGQIAKAVSNSEAAVARSQERLGNEHRQTLARQVGLASALGQSGLLAEALPLAQRTLETSRRVLGERDAVTTHAEYALAVILREKGRFEDAIAIYQKVLDRERRERGVDHPETLVYQNALAEAYEKAGRYPEAIALQETTLRQRQEKLGPEHPYTLNSQNNLAMAYQSAGRFKEAIDLHKKTLEARKTRLGTNHPSTLSSMNNLGTAYGEVGQFDDAIALFQETWEARKERLGEGHIDTLRTRTNIANLLTKVGRESEAVAMLEHELPRWVTIRGKSHPDVLTVHSSLALAYRRAARLDDALNTYRQLLPATAEVLGQDHSRTLQLKNNLATALASANKATGSRDFTCRVRILV